MKIALLTLGTRGDVQPYAVLGRALKERGHTVTLSTARNFSALAGDYGLDFAPVDADFQALMESEEGKKMMKSPLTAQRNFSKWMHPVIQEALQTFYDVARLHDKVLFHGKTLAGFFADQFPEKMIRANVVPAFEPTSSFVNPVLSGIRLPAFMNRLSFGLTAIGYRMMRKPIRQFRLNNGMDDRVSDYRDLRSIYGISRFLLEAPRDWGARSHFTGFWYGDSPADLSIDTLEFLRKGSAPILLTFGSMPLNIDWDLRAAVIRITQKLGIRFIVVKGWGFPSTEEFEGNNFIKVISSAPYEKLLPHVKAAIHHGGIGTTAECLRAGKPFLTCPVLYPVGDQHFWGKLASQKGCALPPIPARRLNAELFEKAIIGLLGDKELSMNAQRFAAMLQTENGIDEAIRLVELS
ncbi:glycosyltransferase [Chitinophaga rhizosphaerae]|uniref:glycosyltransferase n=1 Tax=Chitinophaga rhizosphaerae TaxID=1864947 RepID=UPI000F80DC17|nr:glycosyltransferase [Chitinophaga rhizosphaerae]